MPPKVKFTKDEIIQAALNVARVKGASSVSTRDIAAELQVSTRPIFTYFDTMEEVRAEIRKAAEVVYERYVQRGLAEPIPFLGVGMGVHSLCPRGAATVPAAVFDPCRG